MPPNTEQTTNNNTPPAAGQPGVVGSGQDQAATQPQPTNPASTQNNLQFAEIRDNMIIMRDGSFRAVIACQSINFDLMSAREREGVEYSYQNFLNSLHHSVQILVRSQRIDISPYLDKLSDLRQKEDNMLLGVLMDDYIDFIDVLSQEANIMDKSFYIVVPYFPEGDEDNLKKQAQGFFGKLFAKPNRVTMIDDQSYDKAKTEINNRVEGVIGGLFSMGVQSTRLTTSEISQLYYNFYNPDTAIREPFSEAVDTTSLYIGRSGDAPQPPEQLMQNTPQPEMQPASNQPQPSDETQPNSQMPPTQSIDNNNASVTNEQTAQPGDNNG